MLVLPDGLYYGRLAPEDAASFVAEHRAGRLDLPHLRGRCSFSFRVQAAELFLRRHTQDASLAPPVLLRHEREGEATRVVFRFGGSRWRVALRTLRTPARQLTCRAGAESVALRHELLGIELLHG